jgi:general secretion pathway protein K
MSVAQARPSSAVARAKERARKKHGRKRGVALVMVLGAITVLTVFLTELQEDSSSTMAAALADRDHLRAEYYARSGVNLSRLLLATEPAIRRSIAPLFMMLKVKPPQIPVWEFSDMVLGPFNDAVGAQAFGALAGVDPAGGKNLGMTGGGRFELRIVDEDSKLNVNVATRSTLEQNRLAGQLIGLIGPPQYNELFEMRDADGQFSDRATICSALVDWADYDENIFMCDPTATGAAPSTGGEDNFYQVLGLEYRRKNAPFDSLEELRLVRGMGDDFWSTFVDPDPNDPSKRIMTIWGQGAINVNTANAQTLWALICAPNNAVEGTEICVDPIQAGNFIMAVTLAKGFTMGAPLFTSPKNFTASMQGKGMVGPILEMLQIKPIQFKSDKEVQKQVAIDSKMFSIYAEGVVPGRQRRETRVRIHAVVDRRNAIELGEAMNVLPGGASSSEGAAASSGTDEASPEAMLAAITSNPAGTVVYWRVE